VKTLLRLIYPPLCVHCKELQRSQRELLCSVCLNLLELIESSERCPVCFASRGSEIHTCTHSTFRHAAAFDYFGPAAALVRELKYSGRVDLAAPLAGYMGVQFSRLNWPLPDVIVPVPISFFRFLSRGYNQSTLLANHLGQILDRPVENILKRKSGDFSQSSLDKTHREQLSSHSFFWKKGADVADKVVLLIDDVATTKTTLSHCVALLREGFPRSVYALTVCIA
jgi:competence protein ComFC